MDRLLSATVLETEGDEPSRNNSRTSKMNVGSEAKQVKELFPKAGSSPIGCRLEFQMNKVTEHQLSPTTVKINVGDILLRLAAFGEIVKD
ncbi:hypothetical protein LguiA_005464 [Lonicera macranthoides]